MAIPKKSKQEPNNDKRRTLLQQEDNITTDYLCSSFTAIPTVINEVTRCYCCFWRGRLEYCVETVIDSINPRDLAEGPTRYPIVATQFLEGCGRDSDDLQENVGTVVCEKMCVSALWYSIWDPSRYWDRVAKGWPRKTDF